MASKERPILFTGEMVRAILDGRKTQTRRVIKPQPRLKNMTGPREIQFFNKTQQNWSITSLDRLNDPELPLMIMNHCPCGQVGDKLWVRESISPVVYCGFEEHSHGKWLIKYRANNKTIPCPSSQRSWWEKNWDYKPSRTIPSIHMPKWATRIWLEITGVRVERVQDISNQDAAKEGVIGKNTTICNLTTEMFHVLWDSINAKRDRIEGDQGSWPANYGPYCWEANPWVWVIEFRKANDA